MSYIAILDQDNPCIARLECTTLLDSEPTDVQKNILTFDSADTTYLESLTYTKYVGKITTSTTTDTLIQDLKDHSYSSLNIVKEKSNKFISSLEIKKSIPKSKDGEPLLVVVQEKTIHICELLFENPKGFLERHPQKRPAHHPATILPKLARAAINISGVKKGHVLDPLCGVGGIVIEAAILGHQASGSDIDDTMLQKANINIKHYQDQYTLAPKIHKKDATNITQKVDAIVTDLPYSKTTKEIQNLSEFYTTCLNQFAKCTKKATIMFPDFTPNQEIINNTPWKIKHKCTYYLHRSLSKEIYVLEQ